MSRKKSTRHECFLFLSYKVFPLYGIYTLTADGQTGAQHAISASGRGVRSGAPAYPAGSQATRPPGAAEQDRPHPQACRRGARGTGHEGRRPSAVEWRGGQRENGDGAQQESSHAKHVRPGCVSGPGLGCRERPGRGLRLVGGEDQGGWRGGEHEADGEAAAG
jgi:hypothetical protein